MPRLPDTLEGDLTSHRSDRNWNMDWSFLRTTGRMRRTQYAVWSLVLLFAWPLLYAIPTWVLGEYDTLGTLISFAIMALGLYISWCVGVQRAHDMGRGWMFVAIAWALFGACVLLMAVSFIALLVSGSGVALLLLSGLTGIGGIVMGGRLALEGPDESDRWGPDPR
jgi:uncharacterized membrane protein YhaH (DUF805 family)